MLIIPAIDLKNNKCVRLRQGDRERETIFSEDPLLVAGQWYDAGAKRLHIVDLDGAQSGMPHHQPIIAEIAKKFPSLIIEVGGGVRDEETVQSYLDIGVQYVVLGTRAITQPHVVKDLCIEFPGHIIVGLDMRKGMVATSGWSKITHHDAIDMAKHFEDDGVSAIVFTDIERDGMGTGVNLEYTEKIAAAVTLPIIASGGIGSLDDVKGVCNIQEDSIIGVIVGRALYDKAFSFEDAQALADKTKTGTA